METNGTYLFKVYDCNDETRMKVIREYREYCTSAKEIEEKVDWLFNKTGVEETGWCEIYELCGRRIVTLLDQVDCRGGIYVDDVHLTYVYPLHNKKTMSKKITKVCIDCGIEFNDGKANEKYCYGCEQTHELENSY